MLQRLIVFASTAWLSSGAGGVPSVDGQYLLSSETVVHAESQAGNYDRTLNAELHASLNRSSSDVSLEIRRDSYVCVLHGALIGNTIALNQGQQCPQSITGAGFQAELAGTLTFGSATIGTQGLMLTTKWDVRGTVKVGPISIPVTGTVSTVATGPKG